MTSSNDKDILKNKKKPTAFVVLSCDNYSDLWPMYIHFFEKNWPDCPYDKYFISNHKDIPESVFRNIKIGDDKSWSDGLLKAIAVLKKEYDYIIIALEDLPIIEKVNQKLLNSILDSFFSLNGNFLTFRNRPKYTHKKNEYFGLIEKKSLYRPSCVYSMWNIEVLEDLLVRKENAWEFERYGSIRSDKYDNFFVVYDNFFNISNTVIKGKWQRSEYYRIKKLGFEPSLNERNLNSGREEINFKMYEFIFRFFERVLPIPWRVRRKIVFKLRGYKY